MPDDHEWTSRRRYEHDRQSVLRDHIDEGLAVPHELLISEDNWIEANVRLTEELGAEPYLRNLLSVLKGN
jgi:hypothetical protein